MKYTFLCIIFILVAVASCASCDKNSTAPQTIVQPVKIDSSTTNSNNQMEIKVGASTFTATLYDNATATAFKAMLPITINMSELNGNEKYFDLPASLPVDSSFPRIIQNGDLMVYGSKTLVLFYKSLDTSYSYTKLGRIQDPAGLAAALGKGNITVVFKL